MQTQQGYANPQKSISLSNIWTPQVVILHPQMLKWLNLGTIIHGLHPSPKGRTKRPSFFSNSNSRARRIKERWGLPGQQSPFPTQSTSDQQTNSPNRQITDFLQQQRSIFQQRSPTPPNFDRDINAHRQLDNTNPPSNRNYAKGPKVKLKDNEHLFNQLKVASHNINGLQSNQTKWNSLLDWTNDNKYDIVDIAESNLTTRQCTFLLPHIDDYSVVWSGKDINKIKGSGIGIIIHNKWEKHMGKKFFIDHYLIHLTFFFKGSKFSIIQIYVPPNDAQIQK